MRSKQWIQRLAKAADLSSEPIPGRTLVEIQEDRCVLVENHCGVISYSSSCICIKTRKNTVLIRGDQMILSKMSNEHLQINGKIQAIEMSQGV